MTLEQLRYFLAVTTYMNFTKAASKSYISQPALSRHIAELENSLNTKLLIRDGNSLSLTSAGRLLQAEGSRILDDLYNLEQNINAIATGKVGTLNFIGMNFSSSVLFQAFLQFSEQYPDVQLELDCYSPDHIADALLHYKADIALGFSFYAGMNSPNLESITVSEEPFCVLVPFHHPLAGQSSVSTQDLRSEQFICVGDSAYKNDLCSEVFALLQPDRFAELDERSGSSDYHIELSLESALLRMNAGQGILLLPRPSAMEYCHRAKPLEISDLPLRFHTLLVWNKRNQNPAVPLFVQCFRAVLGQERLSE